MNASRLLLYILIFAAAVAGTLAWQLWQSRGDGQPGPQTSEQAIARGEPGQKAASTDEVRPPASLGDVWQFDQPASERSSADAELTQQDPDFDGGIEIDEFEVYQALAHVRLDDDGNLLLDAEALSALEQYFSALAPELSVTELARLQEIVRDALPGALGEDTAEVIGNYYNYRVAEVDLMQTHGEPDSIEEARERFDNIVALREQTLGSDVAHRLFEFEQIQAYYMFDSMALQFDTSLTEEERDARQQELYDALPPELRQEEEADEQAVEGEGED